MSTGTCLEVYEIQPVLLSGQYPVTFFEDNSSLQTGETAGHTTGWLTPEHGLPRPSRIAELGDGQVMVRGVEETSLALRPIEDGCQCLLLCWPGGTAQVVQHWTFEIDRRVLAILEGSATFFRQELFEKFLFPLTQTSGFASDMRRRGLEALGLRADHCAASAMFPVATDHFLLHATGFEDVLAQSHVQYEPPGRRPQTLSLIEGSPRDHLHFGWGYSTASGLEPRQLEGIATLVAASQSRWYMLQTLNERLIRMLEEEGRTHRTQLATAESECRQLALQFERLNLHYSRELVAMTPRYRELRTHLDGIWGLEKTLGSSHVLYERVHGLLERELLHVNNSAARRQERALFLIALIQIFTIVSITVDYLDLSRQVSTLPRLLRDAATLLPLALVVLTLAVTAYSAGLPLWRHRGKKR